MLIASSLVLAGCDTSEPYSSPTFPFLDSFRGAPGAAPVLLDNARWWTRLEDPVLHQLIMLSLTDNLDLAGAQERVIQARAERDSIPGGSLVTPRADGRLEGSVGEGYTSSASTELGFDWILDPYGARRDGIRAATGRIDIAETEVDAARLLLLLNVANAYVQLRHDQHALALSRRELSNRRATLAQLRREAAAEEATRLDVTRSEARVAELRSRMPGEEAAVNAGLNELAVLAGRQPGTLPDPLASQLAATAAQPVPGLPPDVGIPADLLRNRPDIRIAERRYYVAVAEIGPTRANLYPRLSLSGVITLNLLGGGVDTEYYFGPAIQFPALPMQAGQAAVEARHAQARDAHLAWKSTVLSAILEVENALIDYNATSTAIGSAREAQRLYREALSLTRNIFENEEATLSDVIAAEADLAAAERNLAALRLRQSQSFIALNVRLGAGHEAGVPTGGGTGLIATAANATESSETAPNTN
ncbi:putative efflux pump outer membrane protein TtgC precursor [Flavimaricola marinus]|uniref:Putative efflux pump outer membrane protein TtgC n=2 Tax=Flavimaricola marinus TaxID=1819565 RepID=A0A238LIS8_9RHOB|nr:putative efflux pump outer membrane protein TtgC precursor [Flavimaricola marinus]